MGKLAFWLLVGGAAGVAIPVLVDEFGPAGATNPLTGTYLAGGAVKTTTDYVVILAALALAVGIFLNWRKL